MVLGFADQMKMLGENIVASCDARIGSVKKIIKDTRSTLKNFHTDRLHMGEEQTVELANFRKNLVDETKRLMAQTHTMLNEFRTDFKEKAEELHKMLSHYYKNEIHKSVQDTLSTFHNEMKKLANEFHQAHRAWLNLSVSMKERRGMRQAPKEMACEQEVPKRRGRKKYSRKK